MTETVTIIDYGSGNLRSVQKAVERAAQECGRDVRAVVTDDAEIVRRSDRLILPGVGAFRACADGLKSRAGLFDALNEAVRENGRPFLGVCVGMQLLADVGLEHGETPGFGWIPGVVRPLAASDADGGDIRIPHMGWNTVSFQPGHALFDAVPAESDFYFAHSFYFDVKNEKDIRGICRNGAAFPAAAARDNVAACQFHPEKSQAAGLALIAAFLDWRP
ncbi:MAG: imidazole glycerol phosphate synthase subunit HisH [Pseudomonadota bacterium]